eukprot:scaffold72976_cov47-Phaeocystis_antarctica.AAC.1
MTSTSTSKGRSENSPASSMLLLLGTRVAVSHTGGRAAASIDSSVTGVPASSECSTSASNACRLHPATSDAPADVDASGAAERER